MRPLLAALAVLCCGPAAPAQCRAPARGYAAPVVYQPPAVVVQQQTVVVPAAVFVVPGPPTVQLNVVAAVPVAVTPAAPAVRPIPAGK